MRNYTELYNYTSCITIRKRVNAMTGFTCCIKLLYRYHSVENKFFHWPLSVLITRVIVKKYPLTRVLNYNS